MLCSIPRRSNVIHTKSLLTEIVLEVMSNVVQMPHFFLQNISVNAADYMEVLRGMWGLGYRAWAKEGYTLPNKTVPVHKSKQHKDGWFTISTITWPSEILHTLTQDPNPLGYEIWGVVKNVVNQRPHDTIQSLRSAVPSIMSKIWFARHRFKPRIETVVEFNSRFIK